jgi:hypothetical protein
LAFAFRSDLIRPIDEHGDGQLFDLARRCDHPGNGFAQLVIDRFSLARGSIFVAST